MIFYFRVKEQQKTVSTFSMVCPLFWLKHLVSRKLFEYKLMGECNTILSAFTTYRHLQWFYTHPSKYVWFMYCKSAYGIRPLQKILPTMKADLA